MVIGGAKMASIMVARLDIASKEIADLKASLRQKDQECQELQKDLNFHAIRAAELSGIVDSRTEDDALGQSLKVKTLQNVELTVQVQELRSNLTNLTKKIDHLKRQRTSHRRLLQELGEVARAIQKVPAITELPVRPLDPQDRPLLRLKTKIEGMQSKWKSLVREMNDLKNENEIKDNKNKALECLFHNLNANCMEGKDETAPIIMSLSNDAECNSRSASVVSDTRIVCSNEITPDDQTDSIEISAIFEEVSPEGEKSTKDPPSDSDHVPSDKDEVERKIAELVLANDRYEKLQFEYVANIEKMSSLEQQLEESKKEIETGKQKQGMQEKLLRDLIFQYKELQKECEAAVAKASFLEEQANRATDASEHPEDEETSSPPQDGKQPNSTESIEGMDCSNDGKPIIDKEEIPHVEPGSTFELSDDGSASTHLDSSSGNAKAQSSTSIKGMEVEFEHEQAEDKYERLERECARLEHEYDVALLKISDIEQELLVARLAAQEAESKQDEYKRDMDRVLGEHKELEEEHQLALDTISQVEQELDEARIQALEARTKRMEHDGHLLQVIKEYKELAEKNEHAEAKIESFQEELLLTKKNVHHRDLVHEYRKMESEYHDALARISTLEKELKLAKSDANRSKEEAKSTRKRLAGCHFHYKNLQKQYDEALFEITRVDNELKATQMELENKKGHDDICADKSVHSSSTRCDVEAENERLLQENRELKNMCEELMVLAEGHSQ